MRPSERVVLWLDTREAPTDRHVWVPHFPAGTVIQRQALETGDLCVAGLPGVVVEHKSVPDLVGSISRDNRERFERELRRSLSLARMAVVVDGSFGAVVQEATVHRGWQMSALVGTIAAFTRRYCPIVFCESPAQAAHFAYRFLLGPIREAEETLSHARGAAGRAHRAVEESEAVVSTSDDAWQPRDDDYSPF